VNNPLTFIRSNIGFGLEDLRRRRDALEGGEDCAWMRSIESALLDAQDGTRRVEKIVSDLTTFVRPTIDSGEQTDLNEVLNWSIEVAGHALRENGLLVRRLGDTPPVDASAGRLGQVFVNLLINAAHALDPAKNQTNHIVVTTSTDLQGRAVAEIRDTGSGMTPEVMKQIFDPFFTTKAVGRGTGLGLSVSHGIVASFGGTIVFESEPGQGTLARIVLPCGQPKANG
jgi:two-component system, NtrC family, sensor kinase